MTFRIHRHPDGSLSHRGLGGPQASLYPDGNTVDEANAMYAAMENLVDEANARHPIRVTAEVGERIEEIES